MIRSQKVKAVASFEFWSTVKRKGYLITTFGMPLFLGLYGLIVSIPGYLVAKSEQSEVKLYGVVDEANVLRLEGDVELPVLDLPPEAQAALELATSAASRNPMLRSLKEGSAVFTPFTSLEEAKAAVMDERLQGVYHVPADYMASGRVDSYRREGGVTSAEMATEQFRRLLRERMLVDRVPEDIAVRLESTIAERKSFVIGEGGEIEPFSMAAQVARFAVPGVFAILLFISLMMTSGYLLQGTATEKENKVIEVVLSSAEPDELLMGKLLGLGGAGLLQVFVWSSMILGGSFVAAGVLALAGVPVPWKMIVVGGIYFVATYLFIGSLILASGSIGGNLKESQQFSMVWTLLMVVPFFFMAIIIKEPNGTIAQVFTWIPFTSALTLLMRLTLEPEGVSWLQIGGAYVVLLASTWIAIRFGARLFRVGLLLTGSRPKLREILRQARLADR